MLERPAAWTWWLPISPIKRFAMRMNARYLAILFACVCSFGLRTVWAQADANGPTKEAPAPGALHGPFDWRSTIYPGTERKYWIYVPAQYDAAKPTCVMVVQDGLGRAKDWKLMETLDQLIADGKVPVQIGIFIDHGYVPPDGKDGQPRFNRSYEYDSLGRQYSDFLLKEILPEVAKSWNLSNDPNDRLIAGASSGAICAFNVAWERPDAFRRVFSTIGTYVGLRGGDEFPTWVRKGEPRPLRVFLQDGNHDLNIYAGDWWMANQSMLSALQYAGYDVRHAWGDGGHEGKHGREVLAEALTWLWHDYPQPVQNVAGAKPRLDLLIPSESWREVALPADKATAISSDRAGNLLIAAGGKLWRMNEAGQTTELANGVDGVQDLAVMADGTILAALPKDRRIVKVATDGQVSTWVGGAAWSRLAALPDQVLASDAEEGTISRVGSEDAIKLVEGLSGVTALGSSPDHAFLTVLLPQERHWMSYQIAADRSLRYGQEYGYVHRRTGDRSNDASDLAVDHIGRYYLTTNLGIQVFDPLGRCNLILQPPSGGSLTGITFSGASGDQMNVICGEKVFQRKVKTQGHWSAGESVVPPKPGL